MRARQVAVDLARPVLSFAVLLLAASLAGRLGGGLVSVLFMAGVAGLGVALVVVVHTVRADQRANAERAAAFMARLVEEDALDRRVAQARAAGEALDAGPVAS